MIKENDNALPLICAIDLTTAERRNYTTGLMYDIFRIMNLTFFKVNPFTCEPTILNSDAYTSHRAINPFDRDINSLAADINSFAGGMNSFTGDMNCYISNVNSSPGDATSYFRGIK